MQAVDSVETDGDYKVRFILKNPWGSFLADLAAVFEIVNEKAVTELDPRLEPIGTGPFRMTEWVQDDHITLQKWDKYHMRRLAVSRRGHLPRYPGRHRAPDRSANRTSCSGRCRCRCSGWKS